MPRLALLFAAIGFLFPAISRAEQVLDPIEAVLDPEPVIPPPSLHHLARAYRLVVAAHPAGTRPRAPFLRRCARCVSRLQSSFRREVGARSGNRPQEVSRLDLRTTVF